jgi:cytoskeletal protein RodZ
MSAFGENLRREREMRGVSLEEISSATKISLRILDAIEREDFAKLPGGIFSRSFIRSYAKYLGLDEERAVAEYQLAARPPVNFDLHRMSAGNTTAGRPSSRTPLISTIVVIALLAGGYWLFRYSQRTTETPPSPPPAAQAPAIPAPPSPPPPTPSAASPGSTAAPGAPPATGAAVAGVPPNTSTTTGATPNPQGAPPAVSKPTAASKPPAGGTAVTNPAVTSPAASNPSSSSDLVLQVAATERAWVAVDADGKTVLQRVLNPEEVQTLKAHKSFDVTTGNAQAVILTLNGETLTPLGRHGEVKTVHLTRQDIKNSTP